MTKKKKPKTIAPPLAIVQCKKCGKYIHITRAFDHIEECFGTNEVI